MQFADSAYAMLCFTFSHAAQSVICELSFLPKCLYVQVALAAGVLHLNTAMKTFKRQQLSTTSSQIVRHDMLCSHSVTKQLNYCPHALVHKQGISFTVIVC